MSVDLVVAHEIDATPQYIRDQDGDQSPISLSTDKVGIGTETPNFTLHVKADGQNGIKIQHTGIEPFPQLRFTDVNDLLQAAVSVNVGADPDMRLFVDGADRVVDVATGLI